MARDTHVLKDFEARLRDAGGAFVRVTGKGYRRWHLKNGKTVMVVDLPTKGYEFGHQKKNVEAEIKRALRACGRLVREEPKRERAKPAAAPVQVAATPRPDGTEDRQSEEPRDGDAGRPAPLDTGVIADVVDRDEQSGEGRSPDDGRSEAVVGTVREPVPEATATPNRCDVCGDTFARPLNLGRHRQARHGIAGLHRAKPARAPEDQAAKLAEVDDRQSQSGWRFAPAPTRPVLTGPPPLGMTRPTATLVAGTATMEKVAALAEALSAAARDLVTEYRLVREENTRLTEAVHQMERMFEGLRRR